MVLLWGANAEGDLFCPGGQEAGVLPGGSVWAGRGWELTEPLRFLVSGGSVF